MDSLKLLLVEDDEKLRRLVKTYCIKAGYDVLEAGTIEEADLKWRRKLPDLLVLDVMLPDGSGFELLRDIRKVSKVPVIMLTARSEEHDKLLGFELGVDDYVTKPFSPKELLARVHVILKRAGKVFDNEILTVGGLKIDRSARKVYEGDLEVELTFKEFSLLMYFIDNSNIALGREKILDNIWGADFAGDDRTVDAHIKSLRKKVPALDTMIRTVRGVGYRFEVLE